MKNRIYLLFSVFFFVLLLAVMLMHFHIVRLPILCLFAGLLVRIAFPRDFLTIFSFIIPIVPALSVFENMGFPLNYLLLPIFFLCGMVAGEFAAKKNQGFNSLPGLPRFYSTFLSLLGISFVFVMLRWSNLTLSPLAFFKDTPIAPTGQRISFGIIFPVVETALFMLSPFYFLFLQRLADRRRILIAFLSGQSLSIVFSLVQRLQESHSPGLSLRGLASDPTAFGFLSALSILLAWYLHYHYSEKWLGVFFISISMIGILNSTTRIGFFALVSVILLFLFFNQKKIIPAILFMVFLAAIIFFYFHLFSQSGSNLVTRLKANILEVEQFLKSNKTEKVLSGNLSSRRDVLKTYAWECLQKFPITGVGTGNFVFWVMSVRMSDYFHHLPANQYFFFTSSLGLPGVAVFLFFCFALFSAKKGSERWLLGIFLFFLLFNDYLWFPEIALVFWLVASLGDNKQTKPLVVNKIFRVFCLLSALALIFFNILRFSDLHPKNWSRTNSTSYDYGLYYIESEKGQQFQWTGEKAGIYIYLDRNGRNNNFRLVCGAPPTFFKNREQAVDIFWRGRFFKRAVFRNNDEYPILIEDKECREGFLEFRIRPGFNLSRMNLGKETRVLGVKLFGADIPGIQVISPNGGEIWPPGSVRDIRWEYKGKIAAVKIEMSYDGGRTYSLIGDSIDNNGLYSWHTESRPSMNCMVRISGERGTAADTNDQPFAVASPPSLTGAAFVPTWKKWADVNLGSDGWYVGDFNGDGRSDLMRYLANAAANEVSLSNSSMFAESRNWLTSPNGADGWYIGDFNGDGRSDIMRYLAKAAANEVFLSNGTRFVASGNWITGDNGADGWYVGDFNGDGCSDIMRYLPNVLANEVFLSNGTRFVAGGNWITSDNGADGWYVGDFNGDGRSDIMRFVPGISGAEVFLSDGNKFVFTKSWTGASPGTDGWYIGDFNGDKKCDLMRYSVSLSGLDVFLAGSMNFLHDGNWSPAGRGSADWYIADFNGDGRADLLRNILNDVAVNGGDVLLSKAGSGSSSSGKSFPTQNSGDSGRWLGDAPSVEGIRGATEEKILMEVIKKRLAGSETISIFEIQQEYKKLIGRKCGRIMILRFLKHNKWNK
jgi:hypothetical protein